MKDDEQKAARRALLDGRSATQPADRAMPSNAPAPIEPIRGSGSLVITGGRRGIVSKMPGGPVDWDMWRNMPTAMLWEAVALSLNNDPGERASADRANFAADYPKRLRIAEAHLNTGTTLRLVSGLVGTPGATVSLPEFGAWARAQGWSLPAEFPLAVAEVQSLHGDKSKLDKWRKEDLWSEADLQALCCGLEPNGARPATAPLNDAAEMIRRAVLARTLPVASAPIDATAGDRLYDHHRFYRPSAAARWAAGKFSAFPFTLADFEEEDRPEAKTSWPWGNHETELLRNLAAAAQHWWVNFDPLDKTTAPTNRRVSEWLQRERGVGKAMADKMATMLRADGLPTGPRT